MISIILKSKQFWSWGDHFDFGPFKPLATCFGASYLAEGFFNGFTANRNFIAALDLSNNRTQIFVTHK